MVKQFTITFNQDVAQSSFVPGSTVSGSLLVEVDEPKSYRKITVYLKGQGKVSWALSGGDNGRSYSASETYALLECIVWRCSESPDRTLSTGQHTFPFEFIVPASCPSSYKSDVGNITYSIEGVISKQQHKIHKVEQPFDVVRVVSISNNVAQTPFHAEKCKTFACCCFKSGDITFSVQTLCTGFYAGEEISVTVYIENGSGRNIVTRCELVEVIQFLAEGTFSCSVNPLAQLRADPIQPHSSSEITLSFVIPLAVRPAMEHSNIIKGRHSVNVTLEIPLVRNSINNPFLICIPVSIGNANVVNQVV